MKIAREDWPAASGGIVEDDDGRLWRILGFIDQPAVVLAPIIEGDRPAGQPDDRHQVVEILGCPNSERFHRLVRLERAT